MIYGLVCPACGSLCSRWWLICSLCFRSSRLSGWLLTWSIISWSSICWRCCCCILSWGISWRSISWRCSWSSISWWRSWSRISWWWGRCSISWRCSRSRISWWCCILFSLYEVDPICLKQKSYIKILLVLIKTLFKAKD